MKIQTKKNLIKLLIIIPVIIIGIILISRPIYKKIAINYLEKGKTKTGKEAIKDFTSSIAFDSTIVDAYEFRGFIKNELHDYKGAIEDFNKVLILDPKNISVNSCMAIAKFNLKDYNGAIVSCTKCLYYVNMDKRLSYKLSGELYLKRAYLKFLIKDNQGAISDNTKAIESGSYQGYNNRGYIKCKIGKCNEAIEDFNKAIEKGEPNEKVQAYINRGNIKNLIQDNQGAISDYSKAIGIDKSFISEFKNIATDLPSIYKFVVSDIDENLVAKGYLNLGINMSIQPSDGNRDYQSEAIKNYDISINLDPMNEVAYFRRGLAKYKRFFGQYTNYGSGMKFYRDDDHPSYPNRNEAYTEIVDDLTKAIDINPTIKEAYSLRSLTKFKFQDFNGANEDQQRSNMLVSNQAYVY